MISGVGNYGYVTPQKKQKTGAVIGSLAGLGLGTGIVASAYKSGATKGWCAVVGPTGLKRPFFYSPNIKGFIRYCKDFVKNPIINLVTSTDGSVARKLSEIATKLGKGNLAKAGRAGILAAAVTLPVLACVGVCKMIGAGIDKLVSKN